MKKIILFTIFLMLFLMNLGQAASEKCTPVEITGSDNISSSHPAINVADGSTDTHCRTNHSSPENAWVLYRFSNPVSFTKIKWYTYVSDCAPSVDIQVSDNGTDFTTIKSAINMGSWGNGETDAEGSGIYVRFFYNNNPSSLIGKLIGQGELEVWGSTEPSPPEDMNSLTLSGSGGGIYYPDVQASFPDVDWQTLDRLYIACSRLNDWFTFTII
jgi:hypothetical protein